MFNNYNKTFLTELMERLELNPEDIVIQDPKGEILTWIAKHENCSLIETTDSSKPLMIDPEV